MSVTRAMKYLQQLTESGQKIEAPPAEMDAAQLPPPIKYAEVEANPKPVKENTAPTEDYSFIAEVARGRFSMVAKCADKHDSSNKMYAAKIVENNELSQQELKIHQILCHERIVAFHQVTKNQLIAIFKESYNEVFVYFQKAYESSGLLVTIMEKLQGVDVLTCLSQRHEYTENMVAVIISQVIRINFAYVRKNVLFSHGDITYTILLCLSIGIGRLAVLALERSGPLGPPAGQRPANLCQEHGR